MLDGTSRPSDTLTEAGCYEPNRNDLVGSIYQTITAAITTAGDGYMLRDDMHR